jgi:hypothetical protein
MSRYSPFLALMLLAVAVPLRADSPEDKPLPGERVGGQGQDERANRRIDTRIPTRLNTRVQPRTIGEPLMAARSPVTSGADNGCVRNPDQPAAQAAQTAQTCEGPR